jgi:hypothetical protein
MERSMRLPAFAAPLALLTPRTIAIALWCAAVSPVVARAQGSLVGGSQAVAKLDSVRRLTPNGTCRPQHQPGVRASLFRQRSGVSNPAWPHDTVFRQDRIVVNRYTDVRVLVDPRLGSGTIYLTPELGRCREAADALVAEGVVVPQGSTASYEFSTDTVASRERLVFTVHNGSALVNWYGAPRELTVFAGDRELRPQGTVFAVLVDSATGSAAVYVIEGIVGTPFQVSASPRQGLVFQGQSVRVVPGFGSGFLDDIQHQRETVWTSGEQPAFPTFSEEVIVSGGGSGGIGGKLLLGGVLIGGGAYYLMKEKKKESKSYPITIVISIPIF